MIRKPISADSHITEPPHCYVDRIDPKFRDRAPRVLTEGDGGDAFVIDGMPGTVPMGIVAAAGIDPRNIKKGETLKDTAKNLEAAGYKGWKGLSLREGPQKTMATVEYKSEERRKIVDAGEPEYTQAGYPKGPSVRTRGSHGGYTR